MFRRTAVAGRLVLLMWMGAGEWAGAQITVEGLADRQVYVDRVSFRVPAEPGFEYACRLDGTDVPASDWIEVNQPDYHELRVIRTEPPANVVTSGLVRFIVRSSERGDSEWGLPPWTPYPVINSSSNELASAHLRLITPQDYPLGLEIPVVAWIENDQGRAVRANGLLSAPHHPSIQLRRGVGAGFLAATNSAGLLRYAAQLAGLNINKTINLENETTWTTVAGILSDSTDWPANSRIAVTGNVTIPAGSTLTIGAGTVVRLNAGVDLTINGRLIINGTTDRPVVFTPVARTQPWGGFFLTADTAQLEATGAIFTGSGADPNGVPNSHRHEQCLFYCDNSPRLTLTDCAAIYLAGQFGHGVDRGQPWTSITITRTLIQRCTTGGEWNGCALQFLQSALIETPADDPVFIDGDNDGIYFTTGQYVVRDSLIGWTKDDGIDSGSGGTGSVTVSNSWLESCFHEAFAWSGGGRTTTNLNTVCLNCGQGLECGYSIGTNSPLDFADHCLSLGNLTGARFGDNYDWTYNGFLRMTNSLVLYNYRDVWGMNWQTDSLGWIYRTNAMDIRGNTLSAPNANHPDNLVWDPAQDGWRLAAFMTTPPGAPVGLAFATRSSQADLAILASGLSVGLSTFTTNVVAVDYSVEAAGQTLTNDTLQFAPGETVKRLALPVQIPPDTALVRVGLSHPVHAEFTGPTSFYFVDNSATSVKLISAGSLWQYLDTGEDAGIAWRTLAHDASQWLSGRAELGYGDQDETTMIRSNGVDGRIITTYFRRLLEVTDPTAYGSLTVSLRRDDGGIVYLNGSEVFSSNITNGPVNYLTLAYDAADDGETFYSTNVLASYLAPGTNLVAVEIHQAKPDSSDISFDLELIGHPLPRLAWQREGNEVLFIWPDETYALEEAERVNSPWKTMATVRSPATVTPTSSTFYRLRKL